MNKKNKIGENIPDWQIRFFAYSVNLADQVRVYLSRKKMTTNQMAEKIGITKKSAKSMLSGRYNFSTEEMAKLELLFSGNYDIYERKLLIEKISKKN